MNCIGKQTKPGEPKTHFIFVCAHGHDQNQNAPTIISTAPPSAAIENGDRDTVLSRVGGRGGGRRRGANLEGVGDPRTYIHLVDAFRCMHIRCSHSVCVPVSPSETFLFSPSENRLYVAANTRHYSFRRHDSENPTSTTDDKPTVSCDSKLGPNSTAAGWLAIIGTACLRLVGVQVTKKNKKKRGEQRGGLKSVMFPPGCLPPGGGAVACKCKRMYVPGATMNTNARYKFGTFFSAKGW